MDFLFTILVFASAFVIVHNCIWAFFPRNMRKAKRPFLWFEWVAFLVAATNLVFWAREGSGWVFIFAALAYICSYSSYRDWQAWLVTKELSRTANDQSE